MEKHFSAELVQISKKNKQITNNQMKCFVFMAMMSAAAAATGETHALQYHYSAKLALFMINKTSEVGPTSWLND